MTFNNYLFELLGKQEAFQKPVFFNGTTFLFERFADWLKSNCNVARINGQLHVYEDGIYQVGYREIEKVMIQQIPNLKKTQRREVLELLELIAEEKTAADARFSFAHIDRKQIDKVISIPWSGKHYSERLWKNSKTLTKRRVFLVTPNNHTFSHPLEAGTDTKSTRNKCQTDNRL